MRRFCVSSLIVLSAVAAVIATTSSTPAEASRSIEASAASRGASVPRLPPSCVIAQKLLGGALAKAGLTLRNWVTRYVVSLSGRSTSPQFSTFSCAQLLLLPHPPKPKIESPFSTIPSRIPPDVSLVVAGKFSRAQIARVKAQCLPLTPVVSSSSIAATLAKATHVAQVGICKGDFPEPVIVGADPARGGVVWTASIQPNDEYLEPHLRLPAKAAEQVTTAWLTAIHFSGQVPRV
jgi:hypothetical protein